jgi:hypothetical protein
MSWQIRDTTSNFLPYLCPGVIWENYPQDFAFREEAEEALLDWVKGHPEFDPRRVIIEPFALAPRSSSECPDTLPSLPDPDKSPDAQREPNWPVVLDESDDDGEDLIQRGQVWRVAGVEVRVFETRAGVFLTDPAHKNVRELRALSLALLEAADALEAK